MAYRIPMQNAFDQPEQPAMLADAIEWNLIDDEQFEKSDSVRRALRAMLGDDPESSAIDCRTGPLFDSVSENFRITIADVARFIMELKQDDVA